MLGSLVDLWYKHPTKFWQIYFLILDTLFQTDELKTLVDGIVATVGTDATEHACEAECHTLIQADHLLQFGCPLICKR